MLLSDDRDTVVGLGGVASGRRGVPGPCPTWDAAACRDQAERELLELRHGSIAASKRDHVAGRTDPFGPTASKAPERPNAMSHRRPSPDQCR